MNAVRNLLYRSKLSIFRAVPPNKWILFLALLILSLSIITPLNQGATAQDYNTHRDITCGLLEPGFLGITYEQNTEGKGVIVLEVLPNTPADKYGVKKGDIIEAIDDEETNSVEELQKAISGKTIGETVILTIKRSDEELKKEVKLDKRPAQYKNQPTGSAKFMEYLNNEEKGLKATIEKMDDDGRKEFEEILHKCEAATVKVSMGRGGAGSGVLIASGKFVATAGHVTRNAKGGKISITLPDGRNYAANVIKQSYDPRKKGVVDIAIAEVINPKKDKLPYLELGESKSGELTMVMGYPGTRGKDKDGKIVTAGFGNKGAIPLTLLGKVGRITKTHLTFISTVNAPPLPGNSGGPILNKNGEVIGIMTNSNMRNAGWGTNIDVVDKLLKEINKDKKEEQTTDEKQGFNIPSKPPYIRKAA